MRIGNNAFELCDNLNAIYVSDLEKWIKIRYNNYEFNPLYYTKHLFLNGKEVTNITIPDGVRRIDDDAFLGCTCLTSISIPGSVTTIGNSAFAYCSSLTSVSISNSVTSIGSRAFYGCSSLASIKVEDDNTIYDSRNNSNAIIQTASNKLILGCKNTIIPNSVTLIGPYAFKDCHDITSIIIPEGVIAISFGAFSGCIGLTSITIPGSVTEISDDIFYGCNNLKIMKIKATTPIVIYSINSVATKFLSLNLNAIHVPQESVDAYKNSYSWSFYSSIIKSIEEE